MVWQIHYIVTCIIGTARGSVLHVLLHVQASVCSHGAYKQIYLDEQPCLPSRCNYTEWGFC